MTRPPSHLTMLLSRHTRRRDFTVGLLLAAAAPRAGAQVPAKRHQIALVHSAIPADQLTETGGIGTLHWVRQFLQELRRLGEIEGSNLTVERYSAETHSNRFA